MPDAWDDGSALEAYVGRWTRDVGRHYLAWLDRPRGMRWIDVGCGTGALTEMIVADCAPASVIGVDPSARFLDHARKALKGTGVSFRQGTGEALPIDDEAADCVVSGLVLNFIADKAAAMREMVRCVRPGGTVAAYVWDYSGHVQFMRRFWDAAVELDPGARELDEGVRFPVCRPGPLRELFERVDLQDVEARAIDIPTPFRDFEAYWSPFLTGVGPAPGYCASLDETARTALRDRLEETLPTDPDGMILLAARAWGVRGTRRAG